MFIADSIATFTHTYTYNANIHDIVPCTANSCQGSDINYLLGTIIFKYDS
jgi:hypothetical protein